MFFPLTLLCVVSASPRQSAVVFALSLLSLGSSSLSPSAELRSLLRSTIAAALLGADTADAAAAATASVQVVLSRATDTQAILAVFEGAFLCSQSVQ